MVAAACSLGLGRSRAFFVYVRFLCSVDACMHVRPMHQLHERSPAGLGTLRQGFILDRGCYQQKVGLPSRSKQFLEGPWSCSGQGGLAEVLRESCESSDSEGVGPSFSQLVMVSDAKFRR